MKYCLIFFISLCTCFAATAQQDWKLAKDKDGIKVFLASREDSKFKSIRVECVLDGTISKLISILENVSGHPGWVYKTKKANLLKQVNFLDFIYYSESNMPWPVSNRDGVYHLKINYDTAHNILHVNASAEPAFVPKNEGIVRVPYSKASWYVTEAKNKLTIDYTFEVDPGGSLPAWMVNMFADKGPYETFSKLSSMLKE